MKSESICREGKDACGGILRTVWHSESRRRQSMFSILAVAFILFVALIYFFWLLPKQTELPTVLASELEHRNGLLYLTKEAKPFTGFMMESYADGKIKSRSTVRGGVLDGLSEGWHVNGQLEIREFFKRGVSHGLREKWYSNGVKMSEGTIVEGKHEGLFRRWHENRALAEEVTIRAGVPDGISRAFYPSGFLKAQVKMSNGKLLEQKLWDDGMQGNRD